MVVHWTLDRVSSLGWSCQSYCYLFLAKSVFSHSASLNLPKCINGDRQISFNAGGNPAIELFPIQGRIKIFLNTLCYGKGERLNRFISHLARHRLPYI